MEFFPDTEEKKYVPNQDLYHKQRHVDSLIDQSKLLEDMRPRIGRIATIIQKLTYGQMFQLAKELASIEAITELSLPSVLWNWSIRYGASRPPSGMDPQEHQ